MRRYILVAALLAVSAACDTTSTSGVSNTDEPKPSCTDTCPSSGATECAEDRVRTCSMQSDGCLAWSVFTACPEGQGCVQNICARKDCTDSCPADGATECTADQERTCSTQASGCLAWSSFTACPNGEKCVQNQCALDPNKNWEVLVTSAEIAQTNNGAPWDADNSGPDIYVAFADGQMITETVRDSYWPLWITPEGPPSPASVWMTEGINVQVFDEDGATSDAVSPVRKLILTKADIEHGSLTITNWGSVKKITFTINPMNW